VRVLISVLAGLVSAPLLAACASDAHSTARPTSAERVGAVDQTLAGTVHARALHDVRVLRVRLTASHPSLKIEETCLGGGMLNMTVDFPGHPPAPFSGACNGPITRPLVAGVVFSPNHSSYGTATVIVRPGKNQDYWVGVGAAAGKA
jgi:hypothetical protein